MEEKPTSGSLSSKQGREPVQPQQSGSGLPDMYGDTKIVLLPRDPSWCYTFWEISNSKKEEIINTYGANSLENLWLRVYDVTSIEKFDGTNAHKFFDIKINSSAINWYLNVPETNRSWCVDLGLKLPDGKFVTIVRSNIVIMPRFGVSSLTDEQWAILQREFERLLELSGVQMIGRSSFDIAKLMKERWEELLSVSEIHGLISSGFVSSFKKEQNLSEKKFYLVADTELIVYGETMPNAKLFIQGEEYKLSSDGRFSLRMSLPDGVKEIPIKAISEDGTMEREIKFTVTRNSERNETNK
jgi:hypothetical protein